MKTACGRLGRTLLAGLKGTTLNLLAGVALGSAIYLVGFYIAERFGMLALPVAVVVGSIVASFLG